MVAGSTPRDSDIETELVQMPGHLLRRCQQIAVAIFLEECREFELTPLQFSALAALDDLGAMDQATLGGRVALDRTTVMVVLGKLIERELVTRRQSVQDKRSKIVEITPAGRLLLAEVRPLVAEAQERIVAPLSEGEQAEFVRLLSKLAHANNAQSRAPRRARTITRRD